MNTKLATNDAPHDPMITPIDLHFQGVPKTIASYLVKGPSGNVLVESGPGSTLSHLLTALSARGLQPGDISALLVTHIHFDHAGAAGWWTQQGVPLYVHHFGARHLISPEKLVASATRIYGDQMDTLWGELVPANEALVHELHDGDVINVAGLRFTAVETPGHARHHHVYELGDVAFTGDAAGIYLPQNDWADLPTPPPEFDRETWRETLALLQGKGYRAIYPTHFGPVTDVRTQLDRTADLLELYTNFIGDRFNDGAGRETILAEFISFLHSQGRTAGLDGNALQEHDLVNPPYMTVDGILRYWRKKSEGAGG